MDKRTVTIRDSTTIRDSATIKNSTSRNTATTGNSVTTENSVFTTLIKNIILFSVLLTFCVILLGAYTRLSDAGLGCPDWPGCYGQLTAPQTTHEINHANIVFPKSPVDTQKAQIEMTHRYFAESLGLLIVLIACLSYRQRKKITLPLFLPFLLLALVLFQGLLGMWTVTLRLLPIVVLCHLLGGFATLSLLWLCWLYVRFPTGIPILAIPKNIKSIDARSNARYAGAQLSDLKYLSLITLVVLIFQIALGGWTSANYAALICPDFPLCQNQWLPPLSLSAFNLFGGIGMAEPLHFMDAIEKTTIHVCHRIGALLTFVLGCVLSYRLYKQGKESEDNALNSKSPKEIRAPKERKIFVALSHSLALLLFVQITLGMANIFLHLPLKIAVAHNGIAVLLLLNLITINYFLIFARKKDE